MLLVVIIGMIRHEGWLRSSDSWGTIREIVFLEEICQVVGSLNEAADPKRLFSVPLQGILVWIATIPLEYVFYRTQADQVPSKVIALEVRGHTTEIVLEEIQIVFGPIHVWFVLRYIHSHV